VLQQGTEALRLCSSHAAARYDELSSKRAEPLVEILEEAARRPGTFLAISARHGLEGMDALNIYSTSDAGAVLVNLVRNGPRQSARKIPRKGALTIAADSQTRKACSCG